MKMKFVSKSIFSLILAGAGFSWASAQAALVSPVSQSRSVDVSIDLTGVPPLQSNRVAAAGLGPFARTNTLSGFARPQHPYLVSAGQDSQMGGSSISATGLIDNEPGIVSGFADSDFRVTFRLTSAATCSLTGSLIWTEGTMYSAGSPAPFVRLSGAAGVLFETPMPINDGTPLDYATNTVLPAGEYTLEAHANSAVPFGYDLSLMNYAVQFDAVAVGPVQYAGQVYPLSGSLIGMVQSRGVNRTVLLAPHDLVNAAMGRPLLSAPAPTKQLLALVSDNINHGLRLVVWDKATTNVVAEVGPVTSQAAITSGARYTAVADVPVNDVGRLVAAAAPIQSRLTLVASGVTDAGGTVTSLTGTPVVGQVCFLEDTGTTNVILIKSGALWTGRKIGTTP